MKKLTLQLILCLILSGIFSIASAQTNTWHQKASYPNAGRYAAIGFSIGQYGYIGGGYSGNDFNDFWQYDPSNDSWTQKSNLPIALRVGNTFVINGLAYLTGGISSFSTINNHLWQYNPVTNNWVAKTDFPGAAMYGGVAFAIGSKGYFGMGNAGSATGPYYNIFYEYDPALDTWTQKANFPGTVRYGFFSTASYSYGYAGFGVNESTGSLFNDWWQYDPANNSWNAKANYPGNPRTSPRGFVINNDIYLGTGQDATVEYSDFYRYDEVNNNWIQKANFGAGNRWLCAGFSIGNKGYLGTGYASSSTYNDFWEYSADTVITHDTCITIKPNATIGKDVCVLSGLQNYNADPLGEFVATAWTCGGTPCNDRGLIQFDLSALPANAILSHAGLNFYANPNPVTIPAANYGTANACWIQRITTNWNEQTVTWNTQPNTTTLHQAILPQSTSPNQSFLNVDVTQLVQDMITDPNNSFGFMLRLMNESYYNGRDFASSDHADSTKWPSITLCYTLDCDPCPVPSNLTTTAIKATNAKLNWSTNNCAISYRIRYKPVGASSWIVKNITTNTGLKKITGLTSSTQYKWQVRSKCSGDPLVWSAWSNTINFTTLALRSDYLLESETPSMTAISIFPNPVESKLNVSMTNIEPGSKLIVRNIMGQLVYELSIEDAGDVDEQIDISHLPASVYFISLTSQNKTTSEKFIKQ